MPFQKGVSGNPNGRPSSFKKAARLRETISAHIPELLQKALELALNGDLGALKLLLDKCLPSLKPIAIDAELKLPNRQTLTASGKDILKQLNAGEMSVDTATDMLNALANFTRLAEFDDIQRRIAALEKQREQHP